MKTTTCLFLTLLLSFSIHSFSQEKFVLDGTLKGFEDSTLLRINKLDPITLGKDAEFTTYLINGGFRMEGELIGPTYFSIRPRPKDPNVNPRELESVFFWAENKSMTLIGEKGRVKLSHVSGSKIQDQHEEYVNLRHLEEQKYKRVEDSLKAIGVQNKEMKKSYELLRNWDLEFISNHPTYLCLSYLLAFYAKYLPEVLTKDKAIELYGLLPNDLKTNVSGKQLKNYIDNVAVYKPLEIGKKPYDFILPDSNGKQVSLASLKNKILLIDFWNSGCGPCRKEHKNYLQLYKAYHSKGFEIISISSDTKKDQWLKAMQQDHMIWKSVLDEKGDITNYVYLVSKLPTNYLIDSKGIIIALDLRKDVLANKLKAIFDTP